jgi:hypothetical protein
LWQRRARGARQKTRRACGASKARKDAKGKKNFHASRRARSCVPRLRARRAFLRARAGVFRFTLYLQAFPRVCAIAANMDARRRAGARTSPRSV